jgi:MFS family permease
VKKGVLFLSEVTRDQKWLALGAAFFGFMLDAMDVLLYVFAIQVLRVEFGLSNAQAGLVSSATLIASAIGGIGAGILSDRIGRQRTLINTILLYSLASGGTAFSRGLADLLFWRALVGVGLGGEWSAGATLVAESWPAHQRARAVSLMQSGWAIGYMLAAGLAATVMPAFGWRAMFLAGVLPALLTVAIRSRVREPEVFTRLNASRRGNPGDWREIFRGVLGYRTLVATAVATSVLFAYWGLFTWLPGFLSAPIVAGGAGFDIVETSGWVFAMQSGAFLGYLNFGFLADRLGRRPAFALYVVIAAALTPIYGTLPRWGGEWANTGLLLLGPLVGFFGTGFFSLFGTMLAELYPTRVRGAAQGFVYNFGRGLSALAPFAVGAIADRQGLGTALILNSAFFLLGALLVFRLPETRDTRLED